MNSWTRSLMNCAGCGSAMYARRPTAGHIVICLECLWDPSKAVLLPEENVKELYDMQAERQLRRSQQKRR